VIFTINKIQDPLIKSPRKASWDGITVTKKDDETVVFTLGKPFISFMNNTTIGILPEHLWSKVSAPEFGLSTLNIKGVGTGPYKVSSITKNNDGIPVEYELVRFTNFVLGSPHIKYLNIISYANEHDLVEALRSHSVDQAGGISPENASTLKDSSYKISTSTLPRIFGIFYNSANSKIFQDSSVVSAINMALDRQAIVDEVLDGYGTVVSSPVPSTILKDSSISVEKDGQVDEASKLLEKAGWIMGTDGIRSKGSTTTTTIKKKVGKKIVLQKVTIPSKDPTERLSFTLTTGDTPELKNTSMMIKEQLAKIGVEVDVSKIYETGTLNQKIIRARDYEALLFGQVVNNESDLYAFWHSSQRSDPGLNIAMYSNRDVDTLLESIQKTLSYDNRADKYKALVKLFNKDTPAILIYSPKYLYATNLSLDHVSAGSISTPSDRFLSIYTWYASKDHVWKIFTK
ncbi:MAG: ABC transporter substrate-binding protein, partial [bacterium]